VHTNPILITFCSILYYKNLRNHIDNYKLERQFIKNNYNYNQNEFSLRVKKFDGKSSLIKSNNDNNDQSSFKKKYNQFIVNKWHVLIFIHNNKSLLRYRAHNIRKKQIVEKIGFIQKIKSACTKCPCCKNKNLA
jgi:hypothetical protein